MQKKLILDSKQLDITLSRLCQQLIENHSNFSNCVLLGLQPRGIFLAELIHQRLKSLKANVPLGAIWMPLFIAMTSRRFYGHAG